jgi:hypothetical protein
MFSDSRHKEKSAMLKNRKCMKGMAVGMVFLVLFFCAGMIDLHSGGCEDALLRCSYDPYWQAVPFGVVYCLIGYTFCLKYIEG